MDNVSQMPVAGEDHGDGFEDEKDFGRDRFDDKDDFGGDMPDDGGNNEIDKIFDKLDTEKQAAVIKYAKSMVDDDDEDDDEEHGDYGDDHEDMEHDTPKDMENEGRNIVGNIVNEIVNDVISDRKKKEDRKIRNKKLTYGNPFVPKRRG